jgi:hypothetical protein
MQLSVMWCAYQVHAMCLATIGPSHPFTSVTQRRLEEMSRGAAFLDSADRPILSPGLHPHDVCVAGISQRAEQLCERCWRAGSIARCCHPCGWSICDGCLQKVSECVCVRPCVVAVRLSIFIA